MAERFTAEKIHDQITNKYMYMYFRAVTWQKYKKSWKMGSGPLV